MYSDIKIGVIIPTRSEERKQFLEHAKWQIQRQTLQPDIVLLVDYKAESTEKDITQRYRRGFDHLINIEKCDCIICWEDDDYYKHNYIEIMVKLWVHHGKPTMFGFNNSYYYNINDQKYFNVHHNGRASMMNTLVSKEILNTKWTVLDNDPWTDYRLWTTVKNVKAITYNKVLCIGIKHNIGMCGGNNHGTIYQNAHEKDIIDDEGMLWLEANTDIKSIELYRSLSKTYKPIFEEIKEIDVVVPCNTMNDELKKMTLQFISNLKHSDDKIKFNIFILEQQKKVNYSGVTTLHYDFEFNYNKVMNYGYSFTKSKYVCFCNNDVNFSYNWATEIIKEMKQNNVLSASPFNPIILKNTGEKIKYGYEVRKEMLGWCIVADRSVMNTIGGLSECVNFWQSEVVYADQLKQAGIKHALIYPSVVFHYDTSRTLNLLDEATKYNYTKKQSLIYNKIKNE